MTFAADAAAKSKNTVNRLVYVVDRDIEMDANLPVLGLRNGLEVDPRLVLIPRLQLHPSW